VPFATLLQILEAMPADRWDTPGIRQPAFAKLRVAVLLHTGMPPSELMKLQRHHFDREAALLAMPWRDKGEGRPAYRLALSPDAIAALVAFDVAKAWGPFAVEMVSRSFKRAARRVLGRKTQVRLYDLRHSFGAEAYRRTRDLATVGRLLGHVEGSVVTAQYARGAHLEVDRAAVAAISAARQASVAARHSAVDSLPATLTASRKPRRIKKIAAV
jgi:integrase